MIKRMVFMLLLVGVVLGGIFGFQSFKAKMIEKAMAAFANPPQTVSTMTAAKQDWQPRLEAVGSLRAVNGADLAFEVAGIVDEIKFNSGDDVEAGQVLIHLRDDDDVARLQSLQASAELAGIVYDRDQKQLKIQAVSQATLDADAANLKNAKAQVVEQQAVVDKKTIRAPFAGHLGIRAVDLGQYVSAGTTIVTLQALDPIYVDFFLPQQTVDQIRVAQQVTVKVDAFPKETFRGEISALNPKVDISTRNVQVRATLKNPDRKLLPGMYATVDIDIGAPQQYVTLPQTAITFSAYGDTVYIVEDKGKGPDGKPQLVARQTFVTTGATRGDQVAVVNGLKEGETVVTAGQIKLRNGAPVAINNTVQPTNDPNPTPVEQ
ncbi:MAG TPA: efflux RND transporter periplasmic adaptor subunit [Methylomirabilota bacterium]|nr:efflux RND transporter periplasmic adaptor subunit [Methylomirabilota bacterium]